VEKNTFIKWGLILWQQQEHLDIQDVVTVEPVVEKEDVTDLVVE
jgi:hypothetical protein